MELNIANWTPPPPSTTTPRPRPNTVIRVIRLKHFWPVHCCTHPGSNGYHGMAELECPISADCSVTSQLSGCSLEVKWRPNRWGTWKVSTDVFSIFCHLFCSYFLIFPSFFPVCWPWTLLIPLKSCCNFQKISRESTNIPYIMTLS